MLEKNEPSMLEEIVWTIILLMAAFVGTGYLMKLISTAFGVGATIISTIIN
jgi:hypothetical protein